MPSNWFIFDRIRALAKSYRLYQIERPYQDQTAIDRVLSGGQFSEFGSESNILDQTNLQINRLERYKDYAQMDETGEISLALDLYADEGCLTGDTIIPLLDGTFPTIAELSSRTDNYLVYAFDQKTNKYVSALARNARVTRENAPVLKITLDDGCTIKATSNHLFMLNDSSFIEAGDLKPGDSLKSLNKNHSVVSVEQCGVVDKVYDLEVPQYHCFAAGSDSSWVIVHNSLVDPERKHSLVIRAKSRRLKRELEDLFFNTLRWDTFCRPAIRYLCKYGDLPFEILLDAERENVQALKFIDVYNFTRIETRHSDLVGFLYTDHMQTMPTYLHPWQVMHLRLTSLENFYAPYGRCQNFGTRLSTPDGYKNIEDFREGDKVYVFDGCEIVESYVLAACHSGKKQILRIKTRHCTNECSENHPVMVRQWIKRSFKFGEKWFSELVYKRADELKIGDELVIPRLKTLGEEIELPEVSTLKHNGDNLTNIHADHLSTSQHRLIIPRYVNEDFASLFGFLIGDGWLKQANDDYIKGIDWALGEYEEVNSKYESLLRSYGLNPIRRKNIESQSKLPHDICESNSKDFGLLMAEMGLCSGFDKKRVPEWVYRAKSDIQEAFIKGLIESDGSSNVDKWSCERFQLELSNYELIKDVKMLLHQMGWKCGNIIKRYRDTDVVAINEHEYQRSDSWIIYFYKSDLFESAGKNVQRKTGSCGARKKESEKYGDNVIFEPVIAIEDGGFQETADIQVDHPASNFIADGIVVHNSILDGGRKAFKQLRLMEDAALIYRITRSPEKRVFKIPVGTIPAKEVPEYIQSIARNFKKQRFYNPTTGQFDERYSPLTQEDDFYLPRRPDGTGPEIETLPGAQNLDEIADIEYFKKKMIAPLKIPFSRVGIGEGAGEASEKSLSQSHAEFSKAVQWIQREVANGLTKVALVHLALRGFRVEDLRSFELSLSSTSAMEELYRIETWQTRVSVMADLKDLGWFPKEWIVTHFTDLSPDEIEELKELEMISGEFDPEEEDSDIGGLGGGAGLPDLGDLGGGGDDLGDLDLGGDEGADVEADLPENIEKRGDRLIKEARNDEKMNKLRSIFEKWGDRLGRQSGQHGPTSGYDNYIATNELDGLRKGEVQSDIDLLINEQVDLNSASNEDLLVNYSVPPAERAAAISEAIRSLSQHDQDNEQVIDDEITDFDLPST